MLRREEKKLTVVEERKPDKQPHFDVGDSLDKLIALPVFILDTGLQFIYFQSQRVKSRWLYIDDIPDSRVLAQ